MWTDSLFALPELPPLPAAEIVEVLAEGPGYRVERILSWGQTSPDGFWYDQKEDEWVSLLQGEARLVFEEETLSMRAGDSLLIPAHRRHRVAFTTHMPPCIWLCVYGKIK